MTTEKEKAEARPKCFDMMEILFDRRLAVADKLDAQIQKLLNYAIELYTTTKARTNATIK
jgi:hypothetical protein